MILIDSFRNSLAEKFTIKGDSSKITFVYFTDIPSSQNLHFFGGIDNFFSFDEFESVDTIAVRDHRNIE